MQYYINWNVDPEIVDLGFVSLRYYSLLFAVGLLIGARIVLNLYKEEGKTEKQFNSLFLYSFFGIIIGARLGHCLFYDFSYYSQNLPEMFLPFKIVDGNFSYVGFQGLASHGGAIGILTAVALYCGKYKFNYLDILDKVAIVTPLVGGFIRLGNFFNSEIIGQKTNSFMGVVFQRVDTFPRQPAQLYEAICYFLIFFLVYKLYKIKLGKVKYGYFLGVSISLIFIARFFIEFVKINQEQFEESLLINMGQILSIPFIVLGVLLFFLKRET